jgi:hypothetical protein
MSTGGSERVRLLETAEIVVPGYVVALRQNNPNPFNPATEIAYTLARDAGVTLVVYDLAGRRVATLVSGDRQGAGPHTATWDGTDQEGRRVASGTYFYRLQAEGNLLTRKMVLVQ